MRTSSLHAHLLRTSRWSPLLIPPQGMALRAQPRPLVSACSAQAASTHQRLPAVLVLLGRLGHQPQAVLQAVLGGADAGVRRQRGCGALRRGLADVNRCQLLWREAQALLPEGGGGGGAALVSLGRAACRLPAVKDVDMPTTACLPCSRLSPVVGCHVGLLGAGAFHGPLPCLWLPLPPPRPAAPSTTVAWRGRSHRSRNYGPGWRRWRRCAGRRGRNTRQA